MTRCVVCTAEREAHHGYLCGGHLERLGQMLRQVEEEAAILCAVPSMQQRTGNRGGALTSQRSPARLDVLVHNDARSRPAGECPPGPACVECGHGSCIDIRAWWDAFDAKATDLLSILDVLHSWARVVREERELAAPDRVTVTSERALLTRQLDWVAEQPWVDETYADFRLLVGQLCGLNGTGADKPYCHCPVIVDGLRCEGQVWIHDELQPVWRRYPDRCSQTWEYAPGSAMCDTCGASWVTPADKARLKRMVSDAAAELVRPYTEDGRGMLTAEELVARGLASSVSNVRVTAHRQGVTSVHGHYDPALFRRVVAEPLGDVV